MGDDALIRLRAFAGFRPRGAGEEGTLAIGTQKSAFTLMALQRSRLLERRLDPLGYDVAWTGFSSGPALIEAMREGAIDFGHSGAMPPILAVASGAPIVTLANDLPSPRSVGIAVGAASAIGRLVELRGRRVAFDYGSNAEWLLVGALGKIGLGIKDILPVPLAPAEAEAAFREGAVDAWAVSDPQLAAAQAAGGRILADATGITPNYRFYVARQAFATRAPEVLATAMRAIAEMEADIAARRPEVAAELAATVGLPAPLLKLALDRKAWGIEATDQAVLAEQQRIADHFSDTRRIPRRLDAASLAGA